MKTLTELATNNTPLTENETRFIQEFLASNECGATTPSELIEDNFSCLCIEDLRKFDCVKSPKHLSGTLSSLLEKGVIWLDERDGIEYKGNNRVKEMTFEPDLYWVSDAYLGELREDLNFLVVPLMDKQTDFIDTMNENISF